MNSSERVTGVEVDEDADWNETDDTEDATMSCTVCARAMGGRSVPG